LFNALLLVIVFIATLHAQDVSGLLTKAREASKAGDLAEAERLHQLAVDAAERSGDPLQLAEAIGDLCGLRLAEGRSDDAQSLCLKSLDLLRRNKSKRYLPVVLNNLGVLELQTGNAVQSEAYFKEAIRTAHGFNPPDPYEARVLNNLGTMYYRNKDYGNAEKTLNKAVAIIETELGRDRPELAPFLSNLGAIEVWRKKWDSAEALFDRALLLLRDATRRDQLLDRAGVLENIGMMHHERKNFIEGEKLLREAYEARLTLLGRENPLLAVTGVKLAAILMELGRYDKAEVLIGQALSTYEKTSRTNGPEEVAALEQMASLFHRTNRESDAKDAEVRARAIRFDLDHTVSARALR